MSKFFVSHSKPLSGSVTVSGSKNAVLPILAACLLTEEPCVVHSVPGLRDVFAMIDILQSFGSDVFFEEDKNTVNICTHNIVKEEEEYDLAGQMRASFLVMGPLLSRFGRAKIPLPGGCPIGARPIDLHLKGLIAMGAEMKQEHGYVEIWANKLMGARIYLDFPSVGATENIMMAASLAEGVTTIENAAEEPEISDLAVFINEMGGNITGAGTDTITIRGVKKLYGTSHQVIPDRIEAGTFMVAAAITHGNIVIKNVIVDHIKPVIAKLNEIHVSSWENGNDLCIDATEENCAFSIKTMPFPGFPTDMQAPFMSLMSVTEGTSMITETVFENRFQHVNELKRMGANIKIDSRLAVIEGVKRLTGTQVLATDLRAGAALILSALAAEGDTEIGDIFHIERGYYKIEEKLKGLGASIVKKEE